MMTLRIQALGTGGVLSSWVGCCEQYYQRMGIEDRRSSYQVKLKSVVSIT